MHLTYIAAAFTSVSVFVAASLPAPLLERYRERLSLETSDLALATIAYFITIMITLVCFGRVSDYLGRKPVSMLGAAVALLSCVVMINVDSLGVLLAARALHGIACGIATSAVATFAIDSAPPYPRWLAAATATGAPALGNSTGALAAGFAAEFGLAPEVVPFVGAIVLLTCALVLLALARESVPRRPGWLGALRPVVALPRSARGLLPGALAVGIATWALGGFYQAFSPTIAVHSLGTSSVLVAAVVFLSHQGAYGIAAPLSGLLPPRRSQRLGIVLFAAAACGIVVGLFSGSTPLVIACGILAGLSQGAAFTGSMRLLLDSTSLEERAGMVAAVNLIAYGGAIVPSFVAGQLARTAGLAPASILYAALALVAAVIVFSPRPAPPGRS
ncbi:MFS transporter [Microbacterium sp. No. 7]|uniref:MFS transporter n=1 Tax=Microbacterium sp. No. 7 TaxID=1714373 RepID=UPI0006D26665|nr:MFS transporter [Microbacterium sp. No. 7]